MVDLKRRELGDFLRARRSRLTPESVGLPRHRQRRTPGLRREEVAERAGIGVDWYIRLEQGRPVRVAQIDQCHRQLIRAQLGLSLMCLTFALTVTASFPVIAAMVPAVARVTVAGVPLTLIVLGFAFYPVFLGVGWFYNRQARQLEARFTSLVDPATRRPDV